MTKKNILQCDKPDVEPFAFREVVEAHPNPKALIEGMTFMLDCLIDRHHGDHRHIKAEIEREAGIRGLL